MRKFILLFLMSLIISQQIFPQWKKINPLPQFNVLMGVNFINSNSGWAVGYQGTIINTIDGGKTWKSQTSGTTKNLTKVFFTSMSNGTVIGNDGTILHTTNGGDTWTIQTSGTTQGLFGLHFFDANVGTAVGDNGTILRTTDGGLSWTMQPHLVTNALNSVFNLSSSTAIAVGDAGTVLKTTNGGTSWNILTTGSGTTKALKDVLFIDANNGICVGWLGTILTTTNGGVNWTKQNSGISSDINGVCSSELNSFTAISDNGNILRSADGGKSWTQQISDAPSYSLRSIYFIDKSNGIIVGNGGMILLTNNGGVTAINREENSLPTGIMLYQNYPNPFNPSTVISYKVQTTSHVTLKIYDVLGKEVATLVNEEKAPGNYNSTFSIVNYQLPSGVYLYRLHAGNYSETKKMILSK